MSNTTLRLIIYDPLETLKQTIKDREIQPTQMAYWAIVLMNRLKAQHIEKRDAGTFLTTYTNIPVVTPSATQPIAIVQNRKYFELPSKVFAFDKDGGIEYVAYVSDGSEGCPPEFTYVRFHRTTPSAAWNLYADPYTKPTPSNPYFYVTEDYVVLLGVEKIDIQGVEAGLYMPIQQVGSIDLDAPVSFPEELIQVLQRQLLDLGRWNLAIPADRKQDGDYDTDAAVPMNKLVSVSPEQQQTQQ